jgi:hypothetical protein
VVTTKFIIANGANDTVTAEQLLHHWGTHHAGLVRTHLAPLRYALTTLAKPKRGYHGIATLHLRDDQRELLADLPAPIRADPFYGMIGVRTALRVDEHVIVDGDAAAATFKVTAFVRRRHDVPAEQFFHHWLAVHAPNVAEHLRETEGAYRYVVNHAPDAGDDAPFHGVAELWYADEAASHAHLGAVPDDGFEALSSDILFLKGGEQVLV